MNVVLKNTTGWTHAARVFEIPILRILFFTLVHIRYIPKSLTGIKPLVTIEVNPMMTELLEIYGRRDVF